MSADLPWPALPSSPTVLIPLGSTEQHGPHLPLHTDTTIAVAVTRAASARLAAPVVVAPALVYGASGEHQGFPGTMSLGTEALRFLLVELVRSVSLWAERTVIVNGHGGNVRGLADAVTQLRAEGHQVAWAPCAADGGDAHAGRSETSLMLHLAPHLVDLTRARPGNLTPLAQLMPDILARGIAGVSPSGVLGDPTAASAQEGQRVFGRMAEDVAARVTEGHVGPDGCLMRPRAPSAARGRGTAP
ncbi:mycofactocin biosynthesis peptidyl-dipeptidase MftE [Nonomuraea sp. NPDC049419]|uniref:mycofactocin biosynthesis peptidyl-dipeptidase MftE n=1 Tax=Nonomuraea sp. NPDC049419 TaxID=3155772 RepID=UPI003446A948